MVCWLEDVKYNACDPKFACPRHSLPRFPAAVDVAPFIGCGCIRDRPAFFLWRRVITTKNCLRPERLPTQVHASFYESVVSSVWVRLDSADPKGPYVPYRLEVHSGARLLGACLLPAVATQQPRAYTLLDWPSRPQLACESPMHADRLCNHLSSYAFLCSTPPPEQDQN